MFVAYWLAVMYVMYMDNNLLAKLEKTKTCWIWHGTVTNNGYGVITRNNKSEVVHRYIYKALGNLIPEGYTLDHLCKNRLCANPAHLEPVTQRENTLRGDTITARYAKRTHCNYGHAYTPDNMVGDCSKRRRCRQCEKRHKATYLAKQ